MKFVTVVIIVNNSGASPRKHVHSQSRSLKIISRSCFFVKAKRLLGKVLNFLVICVMSCTTLQYRRRLFETFHRTLYPFKELEDVSVFFLITRFR